MVPIWWMGSWKKVVETRYVVVDLLSTGVLKSKLPITSSYGSSSTSKLLTKKIFLPLHSPRMEQPRQRHRWSTSELLQEPSTVVRRTRRCRDIPTSGSLPTTFQNQNQNQKSSTQCLTSLGKKLWWETAVNSHALTSVLQYVPSNGRSLLPHLRYWGSG